MKALGLGIAAALLLATAPVMAADLVVDIPDEPVDVSLLGMALTLAWVASSMRARPTALASLAPSA